MTAVLDYAIPVLAGLLLFLAVIFIMRAIQTRSRSARMTYGVGRQEARQAMQVDFFRSFFLFIVGLILLGVFGVSFRPGATEMQPAATTPVTSPVDLVEATDTPEPATATPTVPVLLTPSPSPTSPLPPPTDTPPPPPTPTPEPPTAMVNSPNGLWLRDAPGTTATQLENLAHNTIIILLPGRQTADNVEWQQVRAPSGNEGWVAVPFIIYQE